MSGSVAAIPGYNALPSTTKSTFPTNYINVFDFSNQWLPDTEYSKQVNRYGNQQISGFLQLMGAEKPFQSDLIKWSEEGRLHLKYKVVSVVYGGGNDTATLTVADPTITACDFRVGQAVYLSSNTNNTSDHALITAVSGLTFTVAYLAAGGGTISAADTITSFVYGSEFKKGAFGMQGSLETTPNIFEVSPVIIKDHYEIDGSDMAQVGWIEAMDENDNPAGYFWFLDSKSKTMQRFSDYTEMMLIEHREAEVGSGAAAITGDVGNKGTKGLFEAIETDGNVWSGGNPTALPDWEDLIQRLDRQGSVQENALFVNRPFSNDVDSMLAAQSSIVGGVSYGLFDNDQDMALNLGFRGFRKSGYEFYQQDWRYLIDPTLRGDTFGGAVNGVMVPVGSKQVRDMNQGSVESLPFLHVRYRSSSHTDRKMKTWITGSEGGASTSSFDGMMIDYLTERAICTLGANNFFIFKN